MIDGSDTDLHLITDLSNITHRGHASLSKSRDVDKSINFSLKSLSGLCSIETNKGSKIKNGDNLSVNHLRVIESLFGESRDDCSLSSLVCSRPLWPLTAAGGACIGLFRGLGFGLFTAHSDGNLILVGVNRNNSDLNIISLFQDISNIGNEVIRKTGDVDKSIRFGSNIKECSVGSDGFHLGIYLSTNFEICQGNAAFAVSILVLLNSRTTCRALDIVCLCFGFNAVHRLNLSWNFCGV
mmetsp:Transcript_25465/g.54053  ORF Transcript_25465/g.54053 Transcript_25465/m.54053 type:complete len:239 (-) Transcript_25465:244-960(-)